VANRDVPRCSTDAGHAYVIDEQRQRGHPLAGRSSRHRPSPRRRISFSSPIVSTRQRLVVSVTRPCFQSVGIGFWSAPVTHQDQGMGEFLKKNFFPARGNNSCPRKLSVPRRVQGYRIHRSSGSPFRGPTQLWLTAWAYHLIKSSPSCLVFRDGTAANQISWL